MSTNQIFICKYCISNINKVNSILEAEYTVANKANGCTFCFCEYPEPFILLNNSHENIKRLIKLLKESNNEYEHKHNYH